MWKGLANGGGNDREHDDDKRENGVTDGKWHGDGLK